MPADLACSGSVKASIAIPGEAMPHPPISLLSTERDHIAAAAGLSQCCPWVVQPPASYTIAAWRPVGPGENLILYVPCASLHQSAMKFAAVVVVHY